MCYNILLFVHITSTSASFKKEATVTLTDEARCDISVIGFWWAGQVAFLDISVFNPNANRYVNQNLSRAYESNEK